MPFWLPNGTTLLHLIEAEVQEQLRKRGYQEIATPQVLDEELWHRSGHWDNYRDEMYFMEDDERRFALRPMNCPGACLVYSAPTATPTASCRCAWPSSAASPATSARASCTGCCGSAPSPRTTPTSTAPRSRSPTRWPSICEAIDELYARFGFEDVKVELSTRPEKSMGSEEQWAQGRGGADRGARAPGPRVRAEPRRRRLLRAEDRLPRHRRARPLLAVRHLPARLPDAGALRPLLHGRRRRPAPAGDDPPRPARLDGALRRDPDRALRRPLPGLAGAGPGDRPADLRPPQRVRRAGAETSCARPACGSRSTTARSRSARRSATPRSAATPTCWWSATASRRPARSPFAPTPTGELGAMSVAEFAARVKSETDAA